MFVIVVLYAEFVNFYAFVDYMPEVVSTRTGSLVIEVFAGTARLSTVAGRLGFRTLAVDRSSRRSNFAIQKLDLTQDHDVQTLLDVINLEAPNIAWIHLAPPCGTASAARSRPLPSVARHGGTVPQPLRSTSEPQGLSTLTGAQKRVC